MVQSEDFYINEAQHKCMLVNARMQINFIGRGGGKSRVIIPYKLQRKIHLMPRGTGILLAPNYQKMLGDLLGPVIAGWETMGYKQGVHFLVGEKPPKKWNWAKPYIAPFNYDYFIPWYNGHGLHIVSQNKNVTSNGKETDHITGDEAKLLSRDKFIGETIPTLRGNKAFFGHLPEWNSIDFYTDKFYNKKGADWLKEYYPQHDEELVEAIYKTAMIVEQLQNENPEHPRLPSLIKQLHQAQSICTAIIEAPSTDNRYALGLQFFKTQAKNMSVLEFNTAILSKDVAGTGDFYAAFDEEIHGYWPPDKLNNGLAGDLKKLNNKSSEDDADCDTNDGLEITVDWGGTMNSMGIYQERRSSIDKINELFCKPPEKYQDLARKFCYYYRFHKKKLVYFHYDPSGNATRADSTETFAEEFAQILRDNNWEVIMMSLGGKNISHAIKHRLWSTVLVEDNSECTDNRFKVFRINRQNCPNSIISIANAKIKMYKGNYEKDKSSEKKESGVLPEHATHFSDGDDMIMVSKQMGILNNNEFKHVPLI